MAGQLDCSVAEVEKVIVHQVGNKFRDEGILISEAEAERNPNLDRLLIANFLFPVLNYGDEHILMHESKIELNVIKHHISAIFSDNQNFYNSSIAILKHLYSCSTHPNIMRGDFIEVLFKKLIYKDEEVDAVGLFKIENKNDYLDVKKRYGVFDLIKREGISIDSIQKGAIILSAEDTVFIIDNLGKKTKYWFDSFLKVVPKITQDKKEKILDEITKLVSKQIVEPQDKLNFLTSLSCKDSLSLDELKELSTGLCTQSSIESIVNGIEMKYGLNISSDISISKDKLSKCIKSISSKIKIAKDIDLVISNPDISIKSVEIQTTNSGFRAIIDIQGEK